MISSTYLNYIYYLLHQLSLKLYLLLMNTGVYINYEL